MYFGNLAPTLPYDSPIQSTTFEAMGCLVCVELRTYLSMIRKRWIIELGNYPCSFRCCSGEDFKQGVFVLRSGQAGA